MMSSTLALYGIPRNRMQFRTEPAGVPVTPTVVPGKPAIGIPQILSILAWILVFTSFVLQIEEVRSKAIVDPADHILVAAFG